MAPGPTLRPPFVDLHVHLRGGMSTELALERQRELGIRIGVLRNMGAGWPIETDAQLREHLDSVAAHPLLVGVQVNDRDWHTKHSSELLERLDFVLADTMIMAMPDDGAEPVKLWMPELYSIVDPEAWMERYMRHNLRILAEPITVLANPTYLPSAVAHLHDELWTDERMAQVIDTAVANAVALEVPATSEYPSERFIRMARAAGATFSFGTNNFHADPIDMSRCVQVIEELGLTVSDVCMSDSWTGPCTPTSSPS